MFWLPLLIDMLFLLDLAFDLRTENPCVRSSILRDAIAETPIVTDFGRFLLPQIPTNYPKNAGTKLEQVVVCSLLEYNYYSLNLE